MINIQFDHQAYSMQRFGGISRYYANIQKHLSQNEGIGFDRGTLFSNNGYIQDEKFPLPHWLFAPFFKKEKKITKLNRKYARYCVKNHEYDIFHPTYYDPYFLDIIKKPVVLTVYDFIHEQFPEYFPGNDQVIWKKRLLIEKAAHFIAISQSTSNDLQKTYNIPADRITTIYLGVEPPVQTGTVPATANKDYLLFVGERWAYKNFFRWLTAVAPLLKKYDIKAICAGGRGFTSTEYEFIKRFGIEDRITQMQVDDVQLAALYSNAIMFTFPSSYEGFGLPILEAFANNCPAAISNTSCFKEVGGEAVVYFNPYDVDEIRAAAESLISDRDKATALALAGKDQLAKFSMQKCMEQTVEVYQSLI